VAPELVTSHDSSKEGTLAEPGLPELPESGRVRFSCEGPEMRGNPDDSEMEESRSGRWKCVFLGSVILQRNDNVSKRDVNIIEKQIIMAFIATSLAIQTHFTKVCQTI
jgi:hypothetical protein